jgi:hypothetical protein|tara:strand:- start:241 stop:495 length:255 start_codon:yes stop_codon:yes gene_type:complete
VADLSQVFIIKKSLCPRYAGINFANFQTKLQKKTSEVCKIKSRVCEDVVCLIFPFLFPMPLFFLFFFGKEKKGQGKRERKKADD